MTKPFGVEELMARICGVRGAENDPIFDDGVLRIDLVQREVSVHGQTGTQRIFLTVSASPATGAD